MRLFSIANRIGWVILLLTIFLISFPRSWSLYSLGVTLIIGLGLWLSTFGEVIESLRTRWLLLLPPVAYFSCHLVSLILSKGPLFLLEDRLMFILVPFFLYPILSRKFFIKDYHLLGFLYLAGISIVLVYLLVRVAFFVRELVPPDTNFLDYAQLHSYWFFSSNFSILEHPSYLSLKIIWLQILLLYFLFSHKKGSVVIFVLIFTLTAFLFLLASRAAILAFLVVMLGGSVFYLRSHKTGRIVLILLLSVVLLIVGIFVLKVPKIQKMVSEIQNADWVNRDNWQDYDQRTREWYSALKLIKEKPIFGHGLDKVEERMVKEYRKNGWEEEASLNLNAHNQFLEAQMTFGIAGTLSLLWMLLTPIVFRKRLRYPKLAVAFVLMISFFLLFESMFNRQWGIMFFTLFYCLLVFPLRNDAIEVGFEDLNNHKNN